MTANRSGLPPLRWAGSTALVTGAAGGMGEHLARGLADRGCALVLADRDTDGLARVAGAIRRARPGIEVDEQSVDLSRPRECRALVEAVRERHPGLNLVFNNAGAALAGRFDELSAEEFDWLIEINLRSPITIVRGLLPSLVTNQNAHVVNTSSVFGLIGPYGQSAYATSKFGLRGFSESLTHELAEVGVGVTTVFPGGIATGIARNARLASAIDTPEARAAVARFDRSALRFPPERAAALILDAAQRRRRTLLIGSDARLIALLSRVAPALFPAVLNRLGRRGARDLDAG